MQTTSALYKTIITNPYHWFEIAVTIGSSGVLITEDKEWIDFGALYLSGSLIDSKTAVLVESGSPDDGVRENALISVKTSNKLFPDQKPSIGNAVSGQIDLKLIDVGFNIPRMAEIRPYVRVTDGTETSEWIPQGVFYTDTRYVTNNADNLPVWTITGYDAMLKADQPYPYDTQTIASTVVKNIASMMGLADQIDSHVWEVIPINGGDTIQCSGEWTAREHLQYIGALYGGNWTITNEGKLNLVRINDIPYETNLLTDEHGFVLTFGSDTPAQTVTASGAIASFTAGGEYDLDELEIAIEPVQDLHGYDAPYPPGGGKNLLNIATSEDGKGLNTNGSLVNSTTSSASDYIKIEANTQYYLSYTADSVARIVCFYTENKTFLSHALAVQGSRQFTTPSDAYYCRVAYSTASKNTAMLEKGASGTSYAPFSNICPISGHTGVTVYDTGINVWDEEWETGSFQGGQLTNADSRIRNKNAIPVLPSTTYFLKAPQNTYVMDVNALTGWTQYNSRQVTKNSTFTTSSWAKYIWISPIGAYGTTYNHDISINYPSTDHDYHAYTGNTYPITFPETIYGGTDEVVSGQGLSTMGMVDLGTLSWAYDSGGGNPYFYSMNFNAKPKAYQYLLNNAICSQYDQAGYDAVNGNNGKFGISANGTYLKVCDTRYTSSATFKTAMSGVQLVYELATPLTFQLTPTQVKTLLGQNNLWANTGNIINLEFVEPATELTRIVIGQ